MKYPELVKQMSEKILLVGGGGREDAVARRLAYSGAQIYSFLKNRNPSIISLSKDHRIGPETDTEHIVRFALENRVDLAFIGPDPVLETTLVEDLLKRGIKVASPVRSAARIETNKKFMRELLKDYRIEGNLEFAHFVRQDEVKDYLLKNRTKEFAIKPLGLTGGKGVKVMGVHISGVSDAVSYASSVIGKDGSVLLEERVSGEEFSQQVFTDGQRVIPMPVVQDYKRAEEGDRGPNTGGMGSISDADHTLPFLSGHAREKAIAIMGDVVKALRESGNEFRGILYGQFMDSAHGVKVIEINARFADPESINVLHLLDDDLAEILNRIADGEMKRGVNFRKSATVLKYVVPEGYGYDPKPSVLDLSINDSEKRKYVYYAAVSGELERVNQSTSRSLAVIGEGSDIDMANDKCEENLKMVHGKFYVRHDIGTKAMIEAKMARKL